MGVMSLMTYCALLATIGLSIASPLHLKITLETEPDSLTPTENDTSESPRHLMAVTESLVEGIKAKAKGLWTPVSHDDTTHPFYNWTVDEFRSMLNRPIPSSENKYPEKIIEIYNAPNRRLRIKDFR